MELEEAVKFCEEHECEECPVELMKLNKLTKHQKEYLHFPFCLNLVDDISFNALEEKYEPK